MDSTQTLELAVKQHQAGNLREAEQLYRQILQTEPGHVDALHLLGVIAHQVGRHDLAVEHIRKALRSRPKYAEAHCNLGAVLQSLGNLEEAVACYRQAVYLKPDYAEAHNNLGNALRLQGKLAEAIVSLQRAVHLRPGYAGALANLKLAQQQLGRLEEEAQPSLPAGVSRPVTGAEAVPTQPVAAATSAEKLQLAVQYHQAGDMWQSEQLCRQVLQAESGHAGAHYNLGLALRGQGLLEEAAASFRQARSLKPDFLEAHVNLGNIFGELGRMEEAAASFRQALRLKPDSAEAHYNLGLVLAPGNLRLAEECYDQAIQYRKDYVSAHWNRSLMWLLQGDFQRGWDEFEWRFQRPETPPRSCPEPLWQGEALADRTILLHAEQGLGDTLQFVRYAPLVKKAAGAAVLLECQPPLLRLLRGGCPGVDRIHACGEPVPHFDVHAPLLSLPRLLGTTSLERIPGGVPYLSSDPALERRWRTRLEELGARGGVSRDAERSAALPAVQPRSASASRLTPLLIGIIWQGSTAHAGDHRRSVPLKCFVPLNQVPGVRLISLQKGPGSEQIAAFPGLIDIGPELSDFADTAAVLRNLDLVITVDTAVAHVAGALGVAAWVVLQFIPDWRWLLEREDSPWYPSLRLFRQSRADDWDEVFGRVRDALEELGARGVGVSRDAKRSEAVPAVQPRSASASRRTPTPLAPLLELAGQHHQAGSLWQAEQLYRQILQAEPRHAEAHYNLGLTLQGQGLAADAEARFRQALRLKPDFAAAHFALGDAVRVQGNMDEAAECYRQAVRHNPDLVEGHINLGNVYGETGQPQQAEECFQRAIRLDGNNAQVRRNLALLWLTLGEFERGWAEFEWRWRCPGNAPRDVPQPLWQGEPLAGRTILLHAEQGFGDTLQFIRYAPLVKKAGAGIVLLECQAPLVHLLRGGCPGVDQVLGVGETVPPFDVHAPLLSLPRLLGTKAVELIPGGVPYLRSDPALEIHWRTRLEELEERDEASLLRKRGVLSSHTPRLRGRLASSLPPLLIGIVWQGSPSHTGDHRRSVPLERFAPLSRVPGVSLVSLQKGPGSEQLAGMPGLVDLGSELTDFADTAATLKSLDLVVTVDTAMAHLAGALGIATWVALPFAPDWRWLTQREDSPWYPTMRLFRQQRRGEWDEVFERIAAALGRFVVGKKGDAGGGSPCLREYT